MPNENSVVMRVSQPDRWTCGSVELLEYLASERTDEGARILMHAAWHLENPQSRHNAKLDAFAIFLGEWAAKIKNARSR